MPLSIATHEAIGRADPALPAGLPIRADRRTLARLITHHVFPVSPRTLERWPLTWRRVNGKALADVAEAFRIAREKLDAAPPIRGGRQVAASECRVGAGA